MNILSPELVWAEVLRELVSTMPPSTFSTWIKPLRLKSIEPVGDDRAIATLVTDSPYVAQQAEMRCYAQIKQAIDAHAGRKCDLVFRETATTRERTLPEAVPPASSGAENALNEAVQSNVAPLFSESSARSSAEHMQQKYRNVVEKAVAAIPPKPDYSHLTIATNSTPNTLFNMESVRIPVVDRYKLAIQKARLREDYTLDSFAVSSSNEMAYAAAQAVAHTPGQVYNPLFFWGGVGVGKTHLMQAIGNAILKADPDTRLTYCAGEEFLNEIIAAIRSKRTLEFKERYRQLKVLLIDDIQFIAGKDTAQEEFFHTFNAITRAGGQIIMTSDRPPHEIHPLEDRLRSRFEGGLTIDIQQPTFELRTAITLIKAQKLGLDLQMQLAQIIASEVESTRKLEGVVFKLHSAHRFQNKPLNETLVRALLGQEAKPGVSRQHIKPTTILRAVTSHFHVSSNTLRGTSRKKEYVTARHIAMYLLKSELDLPYTEIGEMFGGRDHTSVMHGVQKVQQDISENMKVQQVITAIKTSLAGSDFST